MKTYFLKAFKAYEELITKGEIESVAVGENVCIELRGNICGDILVFISPKNSIAEGSNISDLLSSDTKLEKEVKIAFSNFRLKLNGLTFLPVSLVWMTNIGISSIFLSKYYTPIHQAFADNNFSAGIWNSLPVLLLAVFTFLFGKQSGSFIMKPLFTIVTRIVRMVRKFRNRKVSETNG